LSGHDQSTQLGNIGVSSGFAELTRNRNRIGYAGYAADSESAERWHVRHSVLPSGLGEWITRDPIGYFDGVNMRWYVQSAPISGLDPTGTLNIAGCLGWGAFKGTWNFITQYAEDWAGATGPVDTCGAKAAGFCGFASGCCTGLFPGLLGGCVYDTLGTVCTMYFQESVCDDGVGPSKAPICIFVDIVAAIAVNCGLAPWLLQHIDMPEPWYNVETLDAEDIFKIAIAKLGGMTFASYVGLCEGFQGAFLDRPKGPPPDATSQTLRHRRPGSVGASSLPPVFAL
jgi:RHS repeat-associated protein